MGSRQASRGPRQSRLGLALLVGAIAAVSVAFGPTAWRSLNGYGDLGALPDRIVICDRYYLRGGDSTGEELAAQGIVPLVVNPGPLGFTACVPGACTLAADGGPCDTVIFVRVDRDAYVGYSLEGGP